MQMKDIGAAAALIMIIGEADELNRFLLYSYFLKGRTGTG